MACSCLVGTKGGRKQNSPIQARKVITHGSMAFPIDSNIMGPASFLKKYGLTILSALRAYKLWLFVDITASLQWLVKYHHSKCNKYLLREPFKQKWWAFLSCTKFSCENRDWWAFVFWPIRRTCNAFDDYSASILVRVGFCKPANQDLFTNSSIKWMYRAPIAILHYILRLHYALYSICNVERYPLD